MLPPLKGGGYKAGTTHCLVRILNERGTMCAQSGWYRVKFKASVPKGMEAFYLFNMFP